MSELLFVSLAVLAGLALGLFFFGGLWWTVQRGVVARYPAMLFTGSMILRLAVAAGGFWLVSAGDWQRLVACLAGFLVARWLVTRWTRRRPAPVGTGEERQSCS